MVMIVGLVGMGGLTTYYRETQLELNSGMIREVTKCFGTPIHASEPKATALSQGHIDKPLKADWLFVQGREIPHPSESRIDYCYPKLIFWLRAIHRSFPNRILPASLAGLSLGELKSDRDVCATTRHLERLWNRLGDALDEDMQTLTNQQASELWALTKTDPTRR